MTLYCLTSFNQTFDVLTKRPRFGYASLPLDIGIFLRGKSFEELFITPVKYLETPETRIIKARVGNSGQGGGKSGGFRLMYAAIREGEKIVLLTVYPKKGKYAMEDISDKVVEGLVEELANGDYAECKFIHKRSLKSGF